MKFEENQEKKAVLESSRQNYAHLQPPASSLDSSLICGFPFYNQRGISQMKTNLSEADFRGAAYVHRQGHRVHLHGVLFWSLSSSVWLDETEA